MSEQINVQDTTNVANNTLNQPRHSITISLFGTEMPFDIISASYAIIVAAGGIMGYAKAGSIPSLAAGLTFGTLIGAGSYMEATRE